jgi:hypothetical protein
VHHKSSRSQQNLSLFLATTVAALEVSTVLLTKGQVVKDIQTSEEQVTKKFSPFFSKTLFKRQFVPVLTLFQCERVWLVLPP